LVKEAKLAGERHLTDHVEGVVLEPGAQVDRFVLGCKLMQTLHEQHRSTSRSRPRIGGGLTGCMHWRTCASGPGVPTGRGSRVEKMFHLRMFLPRNALDRVEAGLLIVYVRENTSSAEEKQPVLNQNDGGGGLPLVKSSSLEYITGIILGSDTDT
jgi:hypothetical protein